MKCSVIPVIIEATGTVTKGLKSMWRNTAKECIRFCKKTAVLGTSTIIRKVPQSEI
jgi:hypothetical protein